MKIYNYDRYTKEFVSEGHAKSNPLDTSKYLIPANATTVQPPLLAAKEVALFSNDTWDKVSDFRGESIWEKSSAQRTMVYNFGDIPQEYTLSDPTGIEFPMWSGGKWVTNQVIKQDAEARIIRDSAISIAKTDSGIAKLTVATAQAYIINELDTTVMDASAPDIMAATTVAELKTATLKSLVEIRKIMLKDRDILLKMIPYLLD